jgi:hypothetical protein
MEIRFGAMRGIVSSTLPFTVMSSVESTPAREKLFSTSSSEQ